MNFMESPFYLQELQDLEVLQRRVEEYYHVMKQVERDDEIRKEFLHTLYAMIEKEQSLYTRLQLDGGEEAQQVIAALTAEAHESGVPPHHTLPSYHFELKENIKLELMQLGEDLDDWPDMD